MLPKADAYFKPKEEIELKEILHKVITLRGMSSGAGGFARFHVQGKRAEILIHARGLNKEGFIAFWHQSGVEPIRLGTAVADARGEAVLDAELSGDWHPGAKVQALLLVENTQCPAPLLIGLLEGSMMEARNACITLCAKQSRREEKQSKPAVQPKPMEKAETTPETTPEAKQVRQVWQSPVPSPWTQKDLEEGQKAQHRAEESRELQTLMRSLFRSPAAWQAGKVEAKPLVFRCSQRERKTDPLQQEERSTRESLPRFADDLPQLQWPPLFQPVKEIFSRSKPTGLFAAPGWRFACASENSDGLWIGRQEEEGKVSRIAYITRGSGEQQLGKNDQPIMGKDGKRYRALVQRAE